MRERRWGVLAVLLTLVTISGCTAWRAALDSPGRHDDSKGVHESKPYATIDPRNE